jgi:hypothetical protein
MSVQPFACGYRTSRMKGWVPGLVPTLVVKTSSLVRDLLHRLQLIVHAALNRRGAQLFSSSGKSYHRSRAVLRDTLERRTRSMKAITSNRSNLSSSKQPDFVENLYKTSGSSCALNRQKTRRLHANQTTITRSALQAMKDNTEDCSARQNNRLYKRLEPHTLVCQISKKRICRIARPKYVICLILLLRTFDHRKQLQ